MVMIVYCSHEAMSDLIALMGSLVDVKGRIQIPHIYDSVEQLTAQESSAYDAIDFDMASTLLTYLFVWCLYCSGMLDDRRSDRLHSMSLQMSVPQSLYDARLWIPSQPQCTPFFCVF